MASLSFQKAAILGAKGATGIHLAAELGRRKIPVRVASRREAHLQRVFPGEGFEIVVADLTRAKDARDAVAGCDLVFDCVGLPGKQIHLHPVVARNIAAAVRETGARCVQISSFWAYLPVVRLPLNESHPRTDGSAWVRHRREAEDILQQAGAAILNLPDFYGPHVHTSVLQQPLVEASAGRVMNWIGGANVPHEYVYVPDAMAAAIELSGHEEAYGKRWILPGAGPITGRQIAETATHVLNRRVKLRTAGPLMLRVVSWFKPELRGFMQMVPHYLKPLTYDGGRLQVLLPSMPVTSYDEGIRHTLEWLGARRSELQD